MKNQTLDCHQQTHSLSVPCAAAAARRRTPCCAAAFLAIPASHSRQVGLRGIAQARAALALAARRAEERAHDKAA